MTIPVWISRDGVVGHIGNARSRYLAPLCHRDVPEGVEPSLAQEAAEALLEDGWHVVRLPAEGLNPDNLSCEPCRDWLLAKRRD